MKPNVNIEVLKRRLAYDPETGLVRWVLRPANRWVKGWYPGSLTNQGYYNISIDNKLYRVHRVCWAIFYGDWPMDQIDHIDGNRGNNRIVNLRDVTPEGNARNAKLRKDNTVGVVGVVWNKNNNNYNAQISVKGRRIHLGVFENVDDAIRARKQAEEDYGYATNHGRR